MGIACRRPVGMSDSIVRPITQRSDYMIAGEPPPRQKTRSFLPGCWVFASFGMAPLHQLFSQLQPIHRMIFYGLFQHHLTKIWIDAFAVQFLLNVARAIASVEPAPDKCFSKTFIAEQAILLECIQQVLKCLWVQLAVFLPEFIAQFSDTMLAPSQQTNRGMVGALAGFAQTARLETFLSRFGNDHFTSAVIVQLWHQLGANGVFNFITHLRIFVQKVSGIFTALANAITLVGIPRA